MHVKATLVRKSGTQMLDFPIEKTKAGKFTYATQKNLEQLLEALDETSCVILSTDASANIGEFSNAIRAHKMIDACKWLRSQYNAALRPAVDILREYFNWPDSITTVQREVGLTCILRDIMDGTLKLKFDGLEHYYETHPMERSEKEKERIMKGGH